jgi:hypothetical protein
MAELDEFEDLFVGPVPLSPFNYEVSAEELAAPGAPALRSNE